MAGLAYIHNLASDKSVWTQAGAHARPRLDWSYSDADGHAQNAYRVRIYSASSGGSLLHDSNKVTSSATLYDAPWAGVYNTEYWWTIEVWDSLGDSSGESTRTGFKMLWSQAIYEYAVPGGATSASWNFTKTVSGSGHSGFLFASATAAGGSGRSAWSTSIGALTPNAYVNVLVRLAATTSGSAPSVADMTFWYTASGILPDKWWLTHPTDSRLDPDILRFGSKALRTETTAVADRYLEPSMDGASTGTGIPVSGNTTYTLSAYVRTEGPFPGTTSSGGDRLTLAVYFGKSSASGTAYPGPEGTTSDTGGAWKRLTFTFTTPPETTTLRPFMWVDHDTVGLVFWTDAWQLELGSVVSPWRPGMVSDASVLDVTGVQIDAYHGGLFRLRGSSGTANDIVELGANGLEVTGDLKRTGEAWTNFTYLNSWSDYGSSFSPGSYRKDAQGYVHLRGMVKGGSVPPIQIATLPAGYRPSHTVLYGSIASGNIMARIDVASTGAVSINTGSASWTSLEGLSFKAEL